MGKVFTHMTRSLDGFIADPNDQVGELFDWYGAGDVTVPTPNEEISFQVDDASAEMLRELTETPVHSSPADTCSTSPTVGMTTTRQALPSSMSNRCQPRAGAVRRRGPILHEAGAGPPTPR